MTPNAGGNATERSEGRVDHNVGLVFDKGIDQMITLTVAEIIDLAICAGIGLNSNVAYDDDELETEIVVMECPKQGVLDDDGKPTHYAHIAYFEEYPEEGSFPLGAELAPPNAGGNATERSEGRVDHNVGRKFLEND